MKSIFENRRSSFSIGSVLLRLMRLKADDQGRVDLKSVETAIDSLIPKMLSNGAAFAFFWEAVLRLAQDEYEFVDEKSYDFLGKNGRKIEMKTFTKYGCKLSLSSHYGKGRKVIEHEFVDNCQDKEFLIVDHCDFARTGKINTIVLSGDEVVQIGHTVSLSNKHLIFGSSDENTVSVVGQ